MSILHPHFPFGVGARRLSVILASVLLVTLLAGCDLPLLGQITGAKRPTSTPPKPLVLDLTTMTSCAQPESCVDRLCPVDAQWSPDGARIAVLSHCDLNGFGYANNGLLLFDGHTGKLVARIGLDKAITQEAKIPTACTNPHGYTEPEQTPVIGTSSIVWTSNSQRLAIPFSYRGYTPLQATCIHRSLGVLDLDGSGQVARLALRQDYYPQKPVRWDLQTGGPIESDDPPPALAYRWGSGGELIPIDILSAGGSPPAPSLPGPIGNPTGGDTFSAWQPGGIGMTEPPSRKQDGYGAYTWGTSFAAISPDGRYLIPEIYVDGLLEPNGRAKLTEADLNEVEVADEPLIPVRDAALQQALLDLPVSAVGDTRGNRSSGAYIAWRPDGRFLAMASPDCYLICADGSSTVTASPVQGSVNNTREYASKAVRIYRSESGQVALDLTPPEGDAFGQLRWSADGKRLLMMRSRDVLIWDLGALK